MAKLHFRPYIPNQTVLFPQRIDENIAATDPVRIVNAVIDNLNLESFKKLYKETGRCPHPAHASGYITAGCQKCARISILFQTTLGGING